MKRMLLLESGGKTPASNAAAFGVLKSAEKSGWETYAARFGFNGLLERGEINSIRSSNIDFLMGGSNIGTSKVELHKEASGIDQAQEKIKAYGIDAIVVIGGGGRSMDVCHMLADEGFPLVTIPKSIDNDILGTNFTVGYPTYVRNLKQGISGLKQLVKDNFRRGMVVEINFDQFGWTTAATGLGGADAALIPKNYRLNDIYRLLDRKVRWTKNFLISVSEYANVAYHTYNCKAKELAMHMEQEYGLQTRMQPTGLIYKTSGPSKFDLEHAIGFGRHAVAMADKGMFGHMACVQRSGSKYKFNERSLDAVLGRKKMPDKFYDDRSLNITKNFIDYIRPMMQNE